jgi:hypothetical protein
MPEWIADFIEKGGSVGTCLEMWKTIQASEREERAAERDMRKAEMDRDVKMRELELRER